MRSPSSLTSARTRVWDLPTRLVHWGLALTVVVSIVTAKVGGNWMQWHMYAGYCALALLIFRLLWGFAGSRYALFSDFVRGPRSAWGYLRDSFSKRESSYAGHNPLGAWSVLALLAVLLAQAVTGLFTSDEIATEGPLAALVSSAFSSTLSAVHAFNEPVIWGLIVLHLLAIGFYYFVKRTNLVRPMLTGDKPVAAPAADDSRHTWLKALILAVLTSALVWFVVTL